MALKENLINSEVKTFKYNGLFLPIEKLYAQVASD